MKKLFVSALTVAGLFFSANAFASSGLAYFSKGFSVFTGQPFVQIEKSARCDRAC